MEPSQEQRKEQPEPAGSGQEARPGADTGGQSAEAAGKPSYEELERELQAARAAAAENQDKFLRAKAEVENIRRRAEMDIAGAHKYGVERFAAELLGVYDSLELAKAVDLGEGGPVVEKVREGLDLTLKLMENAFQKYSISVIDPQGQKFDPERHQAVSMMPTDAVPPSHVMQVVQKGFLLHDRLLRPAMVIVARAPEPGTSAP